MYSSLYTFSLLYFKEERKSCKGCTFVVFHLCGKFNNILERDRMCPADVHRWHHATGMPKSCDDLKKVGNSKRRISHHLKHYETRHCFLRLYDKAGNNLSLFVFCNYKIKFLWVFFSRYFFLLVNSDVKSGPV